MAMVAVWVWHVTFDGLTFICACKGWAGYHGAAGTWSRDDREGRSKCKRVHGPWMLLISWCAMCRFLALMKVSLVQAAFLGTDCCETFTPLMMFGAGQADAKHGYSWENYSRSAGGHIIHLRNCVAVSYGWCHWVDLLATKCSSSVTALTSKYSVGTSRLCTCIGLWVQASNGKCHKVKQQWIDYYIWIDWIRWLPSSGLITCKQVFSFNVIFKTIIVLNGLDDEARKADCELGSAFFYTLLLVMMPQP